MSVTSSTLAHASNDHPSSVDFDNVQGDAELILMSSDQLKFYVHKWPLAKASPIFRDMLMIGDHVASTLVTPEGLPTVQLTEGGDVLKALLRVIYPFPNPSIKSLQLLSSLTDAAVKYDVAAALSYVQSLLSERRFISEGPLRVYAIAKRFGFRDVEKEAVKGCYELDLGGATLLNEPEMRYLTAHDLHRLFVFKQMRAEKAIATLEKYQFHIKKCRGCHRQGCIWWPEFFKMACKALQQCPTSRDISLSMMFRAAEQAENDESAGCSQNSQHVIQSVHVLGKITSAINYLPWEYTYP